MDLEFEGAPARGLRRYVASVAEQLGLRGAGWTVQLEQPVSAYLALDQRLPGFPDRDTALLWHELHGWALAVETHGGEDPVVIAYVGHDVLPPPGVVAELAAQVITDPAGHPGPVDPPHRRTLDDKELVTRLAGYAGPIDAAPTGTAGSMSARVAQERGATVVHVAGELEMTTEAALLDLLTRVLDHHPKVMIVDLTEVTFLGSAGLGVLLRAYLHAGERTRLRIVAATPATRLAVHAISLASHIPVYPTLRQALAGPGEGSSGAAS